MKLHLPLLSWLILQLILVNIRIAENEKDDIDNAAGHFSPLRRTSPDLAAFSRSGESLLSKLNIFSYFCRKTGSEDLHFCYKNVK